jgi:hypothetical protein
MMKAWDNTITQKLAKAQNKTRQNAQNKTNARQNAQNKRMNKLEQDFASLEAKLSTLNLGQMSIGPQRRRFPNELN